LKKKGKKLGQSEEQMKIVEEAFEMDEMDKVAAEEWARELDEKKEKEPKMKKGWGFWFGSGIKQNQFTPVPVHKIDKVIHSDERDKRAAKFLVKSIPFPFKSSKQFDSVNKIPVGKEWNSKKVFLKQIAPDVLTRDGEIIQPISK
jgi:U3 small nucleolar RNA-associated protein 14